MPSVPAEAGSGAERLDAMAEARHLAGGEIGVENALLRGAVQLGLGGPERRIGQLLIAGGDGFLDLAQEGADPALARLVDRGAGRDLAGGFLGRAGIRHQFLLDVRTRLERRQRRPRPVASNESGGTRPPSRRFYSRDGASRQLGWPPAALLLADRTIKARAPGLHDTADGAGAAGGRARLSLAIVDGEAMLEIAGAAIGVTKIAQRRAAGIDGFEQHGTDAVGQPFETLRRLAGFQHQGARLAGGQDVGA